MGIIEHQVCRARNGECPETLNVPNHQPIADFLNNEVDPETREKSNILIGNPVKPLSDIDYLDQLREAYALGFGDGTEPPSDPDDRDEYEFIKRKLERKISDVSPDPNTITAVAGRYCDFNSIRLGTRSKFRRELARLIAITGDVPIAHVRPDDHRALRVQLIGHIKPASIQAVFTPIKGIFNFVLDEGLIDTNPMAGVKLPRDKRPIEERKWTPFEPAEMSRVLASAEHLWTSPVRGLGDDRREAILMVVRVLAFSGMRPVEVIRLTPDDVNDRFIKITGSKVIPPKISCVQK